MVEILALTRPAWEIAIRATIVYFALVLLVRFIPKRNAGHISPNDMLVLILVGAMGADATMGDSGSVGDIMLMVALVLGWSWLQDVLEFRFPALHRLMRDRSTVLVEDGRLLRRNMRREMVTEEELMAVLRKEGVDDLSAVRSACMEADGDISVIRKDGT
ncbi:DUF421 domain-containing protein [Ramlibacter sp.]|uniref:DUF421 domain-containing protein n=1 Tax=Ramlibacter sp. TaxID=1917967 RepID=UPI002D22D2E6|nr:YetF domain-containing protein [Ramlibacter sp.]HYD75050.1 YetF domain-containing protein [Ramlibacter sp.]